jgi:hypothetical protein
MADLSLPRRAPRYSPTMPEPECTLRDVRLMKPNRRGVALSLGISSALVLAGIVAIAVAGMPQGKDGASIINLMVLAACGGGAGAWWFGRVKKRPSAEASELRATANGVYLAGKRLVAKKDIASAMLWPGRGAGAFVRIKRHGLAAAPIDLQVKDAADGRKLIETLGFSASQTASELTISAPSLPNLKSRIRGSWLGGAMMFAGIAAAIVAGKTLGGPIAAVFGLGGFLFHAMMLLRLFRPAKIAVGADGVHVRWMWQQQFIPIHDIERAEVVEGDAWASMLPMLVRIHLTSGEVVDLVGKVGRTSAFGRFNDFARAHAEVVAERINEAVQGRGRGAPAALAWDDGILARGERAVGEWVAALRRLEDKVQTFRQQAGAGSVFERLWEILEDAAAAPARRAAAAVALSPHLDERGRERLRIAAQATATPKLRIALEAAAEDDDDRLIRALDEVAAVEEARAADAS